MSKPPPVERQYWLWVTRPEYYSDEDGTDREDLNPSESQVEDWYWTCHKDTKRGDLALVWRTTPKKDIGYLMQAESDAYSLADDEYAVSQNWDWGCDYRVLYKFKNPITIQDLYQDRGLREWKPLKAKFRGRTLAFRILLEDWERLSLLASRKNPGYETFLKGVERTIADQGAKEQGIKSEKELREALARNLGILKSFGYDLELYGRGQEYFLKGARLFIDLLCYDRKQHHFVIIELKNVQADRNTFGQVSSYVGWVQDNLHSRKVVGLEKRPIGLVISRGCNSQFTAALRVTDRIKYLNLSDLGFE
jgi:hypothetical protein